MVDSPNGVGHTDSMDSHDSNKASEKKKSRRPANTAFRQQRLKAWQPILTPKTVLPLFFAIGIIFAPIGGLLLYASAQVQELKINYSSCATDAPDDKLGVMPTDLITANFKSSNTSVNAQWQRHIGLNITYAGNYVVPSITNCTIQFSIPENMNPPVLFYYHLTNFYQNHRRYVNSFYDKQLKGDDVTAVNVKDSNCSPLDLDSQGRAYYPCGLIANSMFNDTFDQPVLLNAATEFEVYNMEDKTNIAWTSDEELYGNIRSSTDLNTIRPPPNWQIKYPNGTYTKEAPPPDLGSDQHFMVWMRTAGLPNFSKLYMRNDNDVMKQGTYSINVTSNFNTTAYTGEKYIIITTKTVMGGKNPFLGIAYIVVGGICILLGAVFTVTHLIKPRKLGDHTYLSWNNSPGASKAGAAGPSVGTATGRDLA